MKTSALFTTRADKALPLWEPNVDVIYYYNEDQPREYPSFETVYFRDPFNEPTNPVSDERLIDILGHFWITNFYCRSLDHVHQLEDFYVEDKWGQYQLIGDNFMPKTWLASEHQFKSGQDILKKRISCRSRDIFFNLPENIDRSDYIIQEREPIVEEMRVFYLDGEVLRMAETRTSKTENQKVRVIGWRQLSDDEISFVENAMKHMPRIDFAGVDLAILRDGTMRIIEINRSPQFSGYYRTTGVNLAEKIF